MLARFSLYGFLKNQRYFEAFLVLAFLEKGLSFFEIGLLVAFRELTVNVLEIPSGAIADVGGRRASLIVAFVCYIASFVIFGLADDLAALFAGMLLFAIGESFRSGAHKALIFAWLRREGRIDDRVLVYGYTRSWSKFGSAVSVVAATVIVLVSDDYTWVFYVSIVPYVLSIINLLGYPGDLENTAAPDASLKSVLRHMTQSLGVALRRRELRRLFFETMGFEGVFTAVKDYLQPIVQAAALTLGATLLTTSGMSDTRRTALLIGPVYVALYLLSGVASRLSHRVASAAGDEDRAARFLWAGYAAAFAVLLAAGYAGASAALIAVFVVIHVLQNLWRPVLISRFDRYGDESRGASLLSIESQARRTSTMVLAPLFGWLVDLVAAHGVGGMYWPLGACGLLIALGFAIRAPERSASTPARSAPDDRRS